jgi:hypothetical protein
MMQTSIEFESNLDSEDTAPALAEDDFDLDGEPALSTSSWGFVDPVSTRPVKRTRCNRKTVLPQFFTPVLTPAEEAALIHGQGTPYFEYLQETRQDDSFTTNRPCFPFFDFEEWTIAKWLMTSGLSRQKINEFLQLPWVSFICHCLSSYLNQVTSDSGSTAATFISHIRRPCLTNGVTAGWTALDPRNHQLCRSSRRRPHTLLA